MVNLAEIVLTTLAALKWIKFICTQIESLSLTILNNVMEISKATETILIFSSNIECDGYTINLFGLYAPINPFHHITKPYNQHFCLKRTLLQFRDLEQATIEISIKSKEKVFII